MEVITPGLCERSKDGRFSKIILSGNFFYDNRDTELQNILLYAIDEYREGEVVVIDASCVTGNDSSMLEIMVFANKILRKVSFSPISLIVTPKIERQLQNTRLCAWFLVYHSWEEFLLDNRELRT